MSFTLVYTNRAFKDIQRLDQKLKNRIGNALKRYEHEPMKHATKLTDPKLGTYRSAKYNDWDQRIENSILATDPHRYPQTF